MISTEENRASLHKPAVKQGKLTPQITPSLPACFSHSPLLHCLQEPTVFSLLPYFIPYPLPTPKPSENISLSAAGFALIPHNQPEENARLIQAGDWHQQPQTVGEVEMMEEGERAVGRA